jgi:hypothetical protein
LPNSKPNWSHAIRPRTPDGPPDPPGPGRPEGHRRHPARLRQRGCPRRRPDRDRRHHLRRVLVIVNDNWSTIGTSNPRRVEFQLGFTIAVLRYGDDEREARAQALAYFEDLLTALKLSPNLTNTVQKVDGVTGTVGSAPVNPSVWGAWFTGTLSVLSKSY